MNQTASLPSVSEWHLLNERERREVTAGRRPVLVRGLVRHWPMVHCANESFPALAAYLLSFDRHIPLEAKIAPPNANGYLSYSGDLRGFTFKQMQGYLADALDYLGSQLGETQCPAFYAGSKSICEYFPGLEQACRLDCLPKAIEPNLWLGNRVMVPTHNDADQNIACIGAGRRRFILFPPELEECLYIAHLPQTPAGRPVSLVNPRNPDLQAFPRFREALAHAQVAELSTGDALYIPAHWWHNVESLEDVNILVNFWWKGAPPEFS